MKTINIDGKEFVEVGKDLLAENDRLERKIYAIRNAVRYESNKTSRSWERANDAINQIIDEK